MTIRFELFNADRVLGIAMREVNQGKLSEETISLAQMFWSPEYVDNLDHDLGIFAKLLLNGSRKPETREALVLLLQGEISQ
jgi:hypothetical protein